MPQEKQQSLVNFIKGLKEPKLINLTQQFLMMTPPQLDEDYRHRSYIAFQLLQEIYNKDSLLSQTDQNSLAVLRKNYESYLMQLNQIKTIEKNRRDLQDRIKIEKTEIVLLKKEISKNDIYLRVLKKHIKNIQLIRQKPKSKASQTNIKEVDQQISILRSQIQFQAAKFRSNINSANDRISKRESSERSRITTKKPQSSQSRILPALKASFTEQNKQQQRQSRLQQIQKLIQKQKQIDKIESKIETQVQPSDTQVSTQKVRKNTKRMTINKSVIIRREEAQLKFIKLRKNTLLKDSSSSSIPRKKNTKLVHQDKVIEQSAEEIQQKPNNQSRSQIHQAEMREQVSKRSSLKLSQFKLQDLNISIINSSDIIQPLALSSPALQVQSLIPSVRVIKQIEIDQLPQGSYQQLQSSLSSQQKIYKPIKIMKRTIQPPLVSQANSDFSMQNMWKIR